MIILLEMLYIKLKAINVTYISYIDDLRLSVAVAVTFVVMLNLTTCLTLNSCSVSCYDVVNRDHFLNFLIKVVKCRNCLTSKKKRTVPWLLSKKKVTSLLKGSCLKVDTHSMSYYPAQLTFLYNFKYMNNSSGI